MAAVARPTTDKLRKAVSDKVVVVTGAASGIGLGMAQLFAHHDAIVAMVDIDLRRLEERSRATHGKTYPYECDVTSWSQQVQMFDRILGHLGRIDVLCCNAGIDPEIALAAEHGSAEKIDPRGKVAFNWLADEYVSSTGEGNRLILKPPPDIIWNVNVKGVVYGIKLAIHHMQKFGSGKIIITGSAGSYVGIPEQDLYAASKHALLGLLRSTSRRTETLAESISLSMINPWLTKTPLTATIAEYLFEDKLTSSPNDVAWAAGYLVSVSFAQANGKCIWVQGTHLQEVEDSYSQWLGPLMR